MTHTHTSEHKKGKESKFPTLSFYINCYFDYVTSFMMRKSGVSSCAPHISQKIYQFYTITCVQYEQHWHINRCVWNLPYFMIHSCEFHNLYNNFIVWHYVIFGMVNINFARKLTLLICICVNLTENHLMESKQQIERKQQVRYFNKQQDECDYI